MAEGPTTEILMQFIPDGAKAVEAECNTILSRTDKLADLTVSGYANGFELPRYFQVDTFKFGVELRDGETDALRKGQKAVAELAAATAAGKQVHPDVHALAAKHMASTATTPAASTQVQSFNRWRSATDDSWRKQGDKQTYNAKIDDFSFTRRIDRSSIVLFDYCCRQKSFAYASMIKRKSAPVPKSDIPENQSYLRLDFKDVLIASVKWSDDDVVEETCTFRAKQMRMQFWAEKFDIATQTDGVLGFLNRAEWINQVTTTPSTAR